MFKWLFGNQDVEVDKEIVRDMKRHYFTQHNRAERGLPHVDIPDKGWFVGTDGQVHDVDLRPKRR